MDSLGGLPPADRNGGDMELESLDLGLFDVDVDLAECFENCPEWNVSFITQGGKLHNLHELQRASPIG